MLVLDDKTLIVKNLPKRQAPKDPTGAERQQRYRESHSNPSSHNGDITRDITRRDRERERDAEAEAETDAEEESTRVDNNYYESQEAQELLLSFTEPHESEVARRLIRQHGKLSSEVVRLIPTWASKGPADWVAEAYAIAVSRKKAPGYATAILNNWQVERNNGRNR